MTSGNRPDYSDYVAHFCKDKPPFALSHSEETEVHDIAQLRAKERLVAILEQQRILATSMPWKTGHAVAFTECPWGSLLTHAKRYSSYGVGFTKAHLYAAHGGPVFYVRADLYNKQEWDPEVRKFVTPFNPDYAPAAMKQVAWAEKKPIDYTHEREWRVPHHFTFRLDEVQFVIVDTYKDVATFPKQLKNQIGREKFLIMDVYRRIEVLWPVHKL